jgi:hypothetical protein
MIMITMPTSRPSIKPLPPPISAPRIEAASGPAIIIPKLGSAMLVPIALMPMSNAKTMPQTNAPTAAEFRSKRHFDITTLHATICQLPVTIIQNERPRDAPQ